MAADDPAPSDSIDPSTPPGDRRGLTVYGRQGSPTVSVALPFSKITVEENAELHAAVIELTDLVQRLATATALPAAKHKAALAEVADQASELLGRLRR